jgi:hypothetical protein
LGPRYFTTHSTIKLFIKKLLLIFLVFATVYSSALFAQTKSLQIGIKLMGELTLYDELAPGGGLQLVYRIAKHGGLETGINWQSRRSGTLITEGSPGGGGPFIGEIYTQLLQIPLLYRFNSTAINFTV